MSISSGVGAITPWGRSLLGKFNRGRTILNEASSVTPTENSIFEVNLVDGETISIDLDRLRQNTKYIHGDILILDVVKEICKKKEIAPNNAGFFGIKCEFSSGTSMWIIQTKMVKEVKQEKKKKFYFRLQFKVLFGQELRKRDSNAYDYYLKQCRYDFKSGAFSKHLEGKDNEKILLRIVILEMMMLFQEVSKEEDKVHQLKDMLKNRYRKYFSIDEILKKYYDKDGPRDMTRCRQKVEKSLNCFAKVTEPDKDFMTEIELLKNFKDEIFTLHKYEREGADANPVELWVSPKDVQKKVLLSNIRKALWISPYSDFHPLKDCEVDHKKGEIRIMIIRGDEPPEVMFCPNEQVFESFCSCLDGYYRLLVNQYYSVLPESNQCLLRSPCFGPIPRDVAARVLSNKGDERGLYLIREHTKLYGRFVLSLISDDHDFLHIEILRHEEDNKKFYSCGSKNFDTLEDLCKFYADPKNSEEVKGTLTVRILPKQAGSIPLYTDPANFRPIIADRHSLSQMPVLPIKPPPSQIFMLDDNDIIEDKPIKQQGTFGKVNLSRTRDGRELVVKRLDKIKPDELLDLYSTLKVTQHEHILGIIGISLKDMFLAYEYLPLGSLEDYLKLKRNNITYGYLLKYLVQITEAVEFLHSKKCIHGDLSITNVYMHENNNVKVGNGCIKWKMASYKPTSDVVCHKRFNFLSPEIILNEINQCSYQSDVWAYGLTIWQLFTVEQPFRNYSYDELRDFFSQHMEDKIAQQPGLIHLNMHNLPFYTNEMFEMLNSCLKMGYKTRSTMEKIKRKVYEDILKKAASKDKKKCYFTHDWKDPNQYNDIPNLLQQNNNIHFPAEVKQSSESDDYTIAEALSLKNSDSSGFIIPDLSIVKNEVSEMDTSPCDSALIRLDKEVNVKTSNGSSQSAPSSPNRPKLYRSNSLNEANNRGDEDLETASILVDFSQNEKLKRSQSVSKGIKTEINSSLPSSCLLSSGNSSSPLPSSLVDWAKVTNPASQSTASLLTPRFTHNPMMLSTLPVTARSTAFSVAPSICPSSMVTSPCKINSNSTIVSPSSLNKEPEQHRFTQSHVPPPPDSPESVRREFTSEHSKQNMPRNDRTRLYLQERINKERDRFHGKRSLSFTDEFEEYKNNTIRAAKRALLGPNPFNIGIQLPDDFLLRTDKRMCQGERTLPPDVKRYFANANLIGEKAMSNKPLNLESYITVRELENRKSMNSDMKKNEKDPSSSLQSIRAAMAKMQTHSPGPSNNEEKSILNANGSIRAPILAYNQPIDNPQHAARFPFNPIPPLGKSNRTSSDNVKFPLPPYPNMQYRINLMQEQLPINLSNAGNRPFFPHHTQRPVALQPNQQGSLSRSVFANPTVINHSKITPVDVNHYEKRQGPDIPNEVNGFRQIDKTSLEIMEKLGTGAFGEVWKGIWKFKKDSKTRNVLVAIKRITARDEPGTKEEYKKALEDIHAEATHLATLSNDNDPASQHIIKLYGLCSDEKMYQIVEEYAPFGQLDSYIDKFKEHITLGDILNYCKQVAVGMDYMHKKGVIHRDLACRNILVVEKGHIKISDFGMSRRPNKEYYRVHDVEKAKIPIRWCALESITRNTYNYETDCWSYGVACWEMFTIFKKDHNNKRATPYEGVEDGHLITHLDKGNRLPKSLTCPDEIWKKISDCWNVDPMVRPKFSDFIRLLNKTMNDIGYVT